MPGCVDFFCIFATMAGHLQTLRQHLGTMSLLLIVLVLGACQSRSSVDDIRQHIITRLSKEKGKFAVSFKDLRNGHSFDIAGDSIFHAASMMKTPVMIEAFRQAKSDGLTLSDSLTIHKVFFSVVDSSIYVLSPADDSETTLYKQVGKRKTLGALIFDMIVASSNLATNMVVEQVGPEAVTHTMEQLGTRNTRIYRGVEDKKAFDRGINNVTTANDQRLIFEKLARGEVVSPEASAEMIRILGQQRFNDIIPARLPQGVRVAHKTGNIAGVLHDGGIITLPDGHQYILVLMSKSLQDEAKARVAMADVSEIIYRYVSRSR